MNLFYERSKKQEIPLVALFILWRAVRAGGSKVLSSFFGLSGLDQAFGIDVYAWSAFSTTKICM